MGKADQGNAILMFTAGHASDESLISDLRANGYTVYVVNNQPQLITALKAYPVDVAIISGEKDTVQTVRTIHQYQPSTVCVIIAEQPFIDDIAEQLKDDVYDVISDNASLRTTRRIINRAAEWATLNIRPNMEVPSMQTPSIELTPPLPIVPETYVQLLRSPNADSINQLAQGLRHELGNALVVIRLNMRLLGVYREDHERFLRHMESLDQGVKVIERIAMDLRDIPSGNTVNEEILDLTDIARQAVRQAQEGYQLPNEVISLEVPESAPVRGVRFQLVRAFEGLIVNAIEAVLQANQPQPSITIRIAQDGKQFKVTITDNGQGLSTEALAHAFEPGYTTKIERGFMRGLGLGLFVAESILDNHAGSLNLANLPEGGTQVDIWLNSAAHDL